MSLLLQIGGLFGFAIELILPVICLTNTNSILHVIHCKPGLRGRSTVDCAASVCRILFRQFSYYAYCFSLLLIDLYLVFAAHCVWLLSVCLCFVRLLTFYADQALLQIYSIRQCQERWGMDNTASYTPYSWHFSQVRFTAISSLRIDNDWVLTIIVQVRLGDTDFLGSCSFVFMCQFGHASLNSVLILKQGNYETQCTLFTYNFSIRVQHFRVFEIKAFNSRAI